MKLLLLLPIFLASFTLGAADLPTVTIEHLYYLQARADRVRRFKAEDMVGYCIAQKLGGGSFENVYAQLFALRIELVELLRVDGVQPDDVRVVTLKKRHDEYSKLLHEEAVTAQNGIVSEGQVASDALQAIARAQNPQ